jgi:hypothetical protein
MRQMQRQTLKAFIAALDPLKVVQTNGLLICFIADQTPELCDAALNPFALEFVQNPTFEQCVAAIRGNG